jgi:hypothetical protein
MKDTKSLSLLLLSAVLFLLSIVLLCTWGYQYYQQSQKEKPKVAVVKPNVPLLADSGRDSLLKIYKSTLSNLNTGLDTTWNYTDSLKGNLDINLKEFYQLRDEIALLLQANTPNVADMELARKKITELQQKVTLLKYHNADVENENKKLQAALQQLKKANQQNAQINVIPGTRPGGNTTASGKQQSITALKLHLSALSAKSNQETTDSKLVEKLEGSFTVKNTGTGLAESDIMVVVIQPNGQVLQKSEWEAGSFETNAGRKIYSCKLRCKTMQGESKQLNFSLDAETYLKGIYTLQLYYNGVLIGKAYKTLT